MKPMQVALVAGVVSLCAAGCLPASPCTPVTCAEVGKTCGTWSDGCGGQLTCGPCVATCAPQTCADLGKACGTWSDGCGGEVTCGPCGSGAGCDAGVCVAGPSDPCGAPTLVWRSANKTNFESYPAPNSPECTMYNGCAYVGQFAFCSNPNDVDGAYSEAWVQAHDLAAVFPQVVGGLDLARHRICLRSGTQTLVVTVIDTCADSDCSGCCTQNRSNADRLVDLEKYTNQRWGLDDGRIEWADLGANPEACTP